MVGFTNITPKQTLNRECSILPRKPQRDEPAYNAYPGIVERGWQYKVLNSRISVCTRKNARASFSLSFVYRRHCLTLALVLHVCYFLQLQRKSRELRIIASYMRLGMASGLCLQTSVQLWILENSVRREGSSSLRQVLNLQCIPFSSESSVHMDGCEWKL
jgi:hypothetical protein